MGEMRAVGDLPPLAVAELYACAGRDEVGAASRRFTADAVSALSGDEADERRARVVRGRTEIAAAFGRDLAAGAAQVLVCVHEGPDCLLEGQLVDSRGTQVATFAASFELDADGSIVRAVAYRTTPVPPASEWLEAPVADAADARRVLEQYFSSLDGGDADGAASCFSSDVLYAYPQAEPGRPRPVYAGREELLAALVERGRRPWRHRVLTSAQRGRVCLVEGDVLGLEAGGTGGWISSVTLDADGLIARYCAFYAEPAIPRVRAPSRSRIVN